jgi:hypothetical protein
MIEGIKTKQDLFNHIATHLIKQNDTSRHEKGDDCAYRGTDGKRCAIGSIIDDEHYDKGFEGKGINYTPIMDAIEASIGRPIDGRRDSVPHTERILLKRLQVIHDTELVEDWKDDLRRVAKEFELELPGVLQ